MRYTRLSRIGFVYLVPHYWSPIASSMVGLHPQVPVSHRPEYGRAHGKRPLVDNEALNLNSAAKQVDVSLCKLAQ